MLVYHNATKLLWLGERGGQSDHWQFPQGGVDTGSSLEENVIRELVEELGASAHCYGAPKKLSATHKYDFAKPRNYGSERFRGQTQTYWVVPFLGTDANIDLLAHSSTSAANNLQPDTLGLSDLQQDIHLPEFQSWRWASPNDVRRLAPQHRLIGYGPALLEFEALMANGSLEIVK